MQCHSKRAVLSTCAAFNVSCKVKTASHDILLLHVFMPHERRSVAAMLPMFAKWLARRGCSDICTEGTAISGAANMSCCARQNWNKIRGA